MMWLQSESQTAVAAGRSVAVVRQDYDPCIHMERLERPTAYKYTLRGSYQRLDE